ncbi:MAG: DUF1844 domain-containing protein [Phycisphaerae bacterium]|nr:DUF1844 domain-containing protein [Phycisphaerae bacterium]
MADESNEKKLIIDEDWKTQAQKEKEKLQEEVAHDKAQERPQLPEADLAGLISMLATQAFYALGLIRTEETKDKDIEPDWEMAKYNIDMLAVLEAKCKGNLEQEEAAMLKATLEQLRMAFVQLSK